MGRNSSQSLCKTNEFGKQCTNNFASTFSLSITLQIIGCGTNMFEYKMINKMGFYNKKTQVLQKIFIVHIIFL
jgi:hypothetical protein